MAQDWLTLKRQGSEITFVVQGPVFFVDTQNITLLTTKSIRKHFPHSKIVFSTWSDQDISGVIFDELILNQRPKNWALTRNSISTKHPLANNVNRQIISSRAGLETVKTRFAVKLRSDLVFTSNRLSKLLYRLETIDESPYKAFDKRVIVLDRITIDPRKAYKIAFNPCDYISAGQTQDVAKLWSRSLMTEEDALWFESSRTPVQEPGRFVTPGLLARLSAESHVWADLFAGTGIDSPKDYSDMRVEIVESTVRTFQTNLVPLGQSHIGLKSPKHPKGFDLARVAYSYTYLDWKRDLRSSGVKSKFFTFHLDLVMLWLWEQVLSLLARTRLIGKKQGD